MEKLEKDIHEILFPGIEFLWTAFCEARSLSGDGQILESDWRNSKCDVQALWAHIHHRRDVFVTSDRNFHSASKRATLMSLGSGQIAFPEIAAAQLDGPNPGGP